MNLCQITLKNVGLFDFFLNEKTVWRNAYIVSTPQFKNYVATLSFFNFLTKKAEFGSCIYKK